LKKHERAVGFHTTKLQGLAVVGSTPPGIEPSWQIRQQSAALLLAPHDQLVLFTPRQSVSR
jgi:hypothetical protein